MSNDIIFSIIAGVAFLLVLDLYFYVINERKKVINERKNKNKSIF